MFNFSIHCWKEGRGFWPPLLLICFMLVWFPYFLEPIFFVFWSAGFWTPRRIFHPWDYHSKISCWLLKFICIIQKGSFFSSCKSKMLRVSNYPHFLTFHSYISSIQSAEFGGALLKWWWKWKPGIQSEGLYIPVEWDTAHSSYSRVYWVCFLVFSMCTFCEMFHASCPSCIQRNWGGSRKRQWPNRLNENS